MKPQKKRIHGYRLVYDKDARKGVEHLRSDLQRGEAKTIFEAAKRLGAAEFEDDSDRDWSVNYNRRDNTFTLYRRERE